MPVFTIGDDQEENPNAQASQREGEEETGQRKEEPQQRENDNDRDPIQNDLESGNQSIFRSVNLNVP